jgi:hypothetical protein
LAASLLVIPAAFAWGDDQGLAARCVGAIRAAIAVMPAGPVLLNSFVVDDGPGAADFDLTQANAAYVYDNALAGLALLAAGDRDDAARIGEALALAQAHDRFWKDGRLRNAYQAGGMTAPARLPGWWDRGANLWREDPYQVGSEAGPVAWAMLLWAALGMAGPANRAGDWLDDQLRAPSGYYGGFYGFEPAPLKLVWQSTEQNTDLYAAFGKLGRSEDAAHAGGFVRGMFDPGTRLFDAGLTPGGGANKLLAADAGSWPYLAGLGDAGSAFAAVAGLLRGKGVGFSAASGGVWLEGTAFAALVLEKQGDGLADEFLKTVAAQISPSGYVYASLAPVLSTGFEVGPAPPGGAAQKFDYYRRPALAPTAWAALAGLGVNPLKR